MIPTSSYPVSAFYTERREDLQSIKLTPMLLVSFYALLLQISPALSIIESIIVVLSDQDMRLAFTARTLREADCIEKEYSLLPAFCKQSAFCL